MNLLLALLIAIAPVFGWDDTVAPTSVITWHGPGALLHIRGGVVIERIEEPADVPAITRTASAVSGDIFCVLRGSQTDGCLMVPEPPRLVFLPAVEG